MTSDERASVCDPRKRNGRMTVGSALNNDDEDDDDVDSHADVAAAAAAAASEPWPPATEARHSHENDDVILDEDEGMRGTEGVVVEQ